MKLIITGRRMEATKKIKNYIRKRFAKFATFLQKDTELQVVLESERYKKYVEVIAKDKLYTITVRQGTKDIFQSIDLAAEKINQQLTRKHEKIVDSKTNQKLKQKTLKKIKASETKPPKKTEEGQIVETLNWENKPMSIEEALLQIKTLNESYLIFEDADTGQLGLLMKRNDGNYRLIIKE